MILFKKVKDLRKYLLLHKTNCLSVGFVPTMGALHEGHLSLVHASLLENKITVCSIFVNPAQFNNADDFKHYPITIEKDIELLVANGCDVLFLPSKEEVYPEDHVTKKYELGGLEDILEGYYRPGHFQGVCQVVDRLLQIVEPDKLYLGQKDYQQCKVIDKLIELTGKQNDVKLTIVPTVREKDGLAMSSRNLRLSEEQRRQVPSIFEALTIVRINFKKTSPLKLKKNAAFFLENKGFKVDYFEIANTSTLEPSTGNNDLSIALVAVYVGNIRLIDNLLLN